MRVGVGLVQCALRVDYRLLAERAPRVDSDDPLDHAVGDLLLAVRCGSHGDREMAEQRVRARRDGEGVERHRSAVARAVAAARHDRGISAVAQSAGHEIDRGVDARTIEPLARGDRQVGEDLVALPQ